MCETKCHNRNVLSELVDEYVTARRRQRYSADTLKIMQRAVRRFLDATQVERIQDVSLEHLHAFRLDLLNHGFASSSIELYTRSVRQFFNWLEDTGHLFANPAQGFIIPKSERTLLPVPSVRDIRKLLAQPNTSQPTGLRDRAMMETAYSTGARAGELTGLTIFHPDIQQGRLRILGKGRKERVVPLGKHACYWLKNYLLHGRPKLLGECVDNEALWIGLNGEKLNAPGYRVRMRYHSQNGGIDPTVTPHGLRRACATHMLQNGAHPIQLQLLLGHTNLQTLSQYLRVSITEMKKTHTQSKPGR